MKRVLLVVSAALTEGWMDRPGPRKDYAAIAQALDAAVLDQSCVAASRLARLVERWFGTPVAQAWLAFRLRRKYPVMVTDGEHIGIPLALLLKLAAARTVHVTIGHRISATKKRPFFRWLKVHSHISRIILHAYSQYQAALRLGIPAGRLALMPYQVDTRFWQPGEVPEERLIVSAGLEFRDYPTLFEAVAGLDAQVVIGAASYWSRRRNTALQATPPPNVEIGGFDYAALRQLYARAALVVVPLSEVDFQAGVTTLLEAMAMGKAVVVSHTTGQTDVVIDRRQATRGDPPRPLPVSLLRMIAAEEGETIEPNGFYVPPGDPAALRRAINYLLEHPDERKTLGDAGRQAVERLMTVDQFAKRVREVVEGALNDRGRTLAQDRPNTPDGPSSA